MKGKSIFKVSAPLKSNIWTLKMILKGFFLLNIDKRNRIGALLGVLAFHQKGSSAFTGDLMQHGLPPSRELVLL